MAATQEQQTMTSGGQLLHWLKSQTLSRPPYPKQKFTGQTIVVTGSNVGLGLEAARHFVRLDAAKVILAVRTVEKGEQARKDILRTEKCDASKVEVWQLDLSSTESTKAFAKRANSDLERLDAVVANAGVLLYDFKVCEGVEETIQVNVINTFLLGLMLLPKLRQTSVDQKRETVLTFVGSFVHYLTTFPERKANNIFEELNKKESARIEDRYNVSKLIELLLVRELAPKLDASSKPGTVITSILNPGYVHTSIMRHNEVFAFRVFMAGLRTGFSRTAEQGARTLVYAAYGGRETHGKYLMDCTVGKVSEFVVSPEGKQTQAKLWQELSQILERSEPGVMSNI